MNANAVPQADVKVGLRRVSVGFSLAVVALLAGVLGGTAEAAPAVGKDGQIHACYQVKGKVKGTMRIASGKRCRRGERKLAWSVVAPVTAQGAGAAGTQGSTGSGGTGGANGAAGTSGAAGTNGDSEAATAALESKVAALTLKVETLEGVLAGVTNGSLTGAIGTVVGLSNSDLTGAVGAVEGLSNSDLAGAVKAVPAVQSLCTQASTLTGRANSLGSSLEGTTLAGIIPFGLGLNVPGLLPALPTYACP